MLLTFTPREGAMSTAERTYDHPQDRWQDPATGIWRSCIRAGSSLMILGFIFWWPVGLAILAFMIWSGGMGCYGGDRWHRKMERMEEKMGRMRERMERFGGWRSALERQPRVRRISHRDAAAARGGAARVPRLPRPAALRQGQGRVRPVHGRAAQSPAPTAAAAAARRADRRPAGFAFSGPLADKAGGPDALRWPRCAIASRCGADKRLQRSPVPVTKP